MSLDLIIDTSTERAVVAIAEAATPLFARHLPIGYQSSRWVVSAIEEGFKQLKIKPAALRLVAVGVGPGLLTGVRVGVAVAKGIAFA